VKAVQLKSKLQHPGTSSAAARLLRQSYNLSEVFYSYYRLVALYAPEEKFAARFKNDGISIFASLKLLKTVIE
jgi:hypothetical protein